MTVFADLRIGGIVYRLNVVESEIVNDEFGLGKHRILIQEKMLLRNCPVCFECGRHRSHDSSIRVARAVDGARIVNKDVVEVPCVIWTRKPCKVFEAELKT